MTGLATLVEDSCGANGCDVGEAIITVALILAVCFFAWLVFKG